MDNSLENNRTLDEQLADFTDDLLNGTIGEEESLSPTDPELRVLQQTALRLKNAFPEDGPSEAAIQRMRQNVVRQWKEQEMKTSKPSWVNFLSTRKPRGQKWQSQRARQRLSQVWYLATIAVLVVISLPLMKKVGSAQPAASGQNLGFSLFVVLGSFLIFAVWFYNRKR
jgi:hypothetical protein